MTISIFSRRKIKNQIDALEIDATITESHEYENDVTDYPVEDGFNITDHAKQRPEILVMECINTQTPITSSDTNIKREDDSDRILNHYNTLLGYAGFAPPKQPGVEAIKISSPKILDIVTGLKTWTSMVITKLTFPFSRTTGNAINFTVQFKKIKKVKPELTLIPKVANVSGNTPNIEQKATKTQDAGKLSTEEIVSDSILFNAATEEIQKATGVVQ